MRGESRVDQARRPRAGSEVFDDNAHENGVGNSDATPEHSHAKHHLRKLSQLRAIQRDHQSVGHYALA